MYHDASEQPRLRRPGGAREESEPENTSTQNIRACHQQPGPGVPGSRGKYFNTKQCQCPTWNVLYVFMYICISTVCRQHDSGVPAAARLYRQSFRMLRHSLALVSNTALRIRSSSTTGVPCSFFSMMKMITRERHIFISNFPLFEHIRDIGAFGPPHISCKLFQ